MNLPTAATFAKFIVAAAIGSAGTLGVAAAVQAQPTSTAKLGPANLYEARTPGDGTAFGLVPNPPANLQPLAPPPANQGIQLITFTNNPAPAQAADNGAAAPWWSSGNHSRVPLISQFDGGPLQDANCTLASGAMLARLGFGIVTTGSQLRTLQSNQSSGTTLGDLEQAVHNGWGIQFPAAAVTPLQFRALIYAGAGAVLQGDYSQIPVNLRLQADFTGGHAIYIDGFRPPANGQPAAYWVNDPIGTPWTGYKGGWWPADVVEQFATSFGGGLMLTAWTFAGGATPPAHFPALPPSAYPTSSTGPGATPTASLPSGAPTPPASPTPSGAPTPTSIPLPTGAPAPSFPPSGNNGPKIPLSVIGLSKVLVEAGSSTIQPNFSICVLPPLPAYCPTGIPVTFPSGGGPLPTVPPIGPPVNLLYASTPQPGLIQVIFSAAGSGGSLAFWPTDGSGPVRTATDVQPAMLGGKQVWIATFPVQLGGSYEFAAGTSGDGIGGVSRIGSVSVGP